MAIEEHLILMPSQLGDGVYNLGIKVVAESLATATIIVQMVEFCFYIPENCASFEFFK